MDIDMEIARLKERIKALEIKKSEVVSKPLPFVRRIRNLDKWAYVSDYFEPYTGEIRKEYTTITGITQLVRVVSNTVTLTQREPRYNCPIYFDHKDNTVSIKELSEEDKDYFARMAEEIIEVLYKYKVEYNKKTGSPKITKRER